MKVCIDIQPAIGQRAGVGRYTKCLVDELAPLRGEDELELFYFDFKRNGSPFSLEGVHEKSVQWIPGRFVQKAWKTILFPPFQWFSGPADVFHFTNFIRPPLNRRFKSIVNVHDLSFFRHPETLEPKNYQYITRNIRRTAREADVLLAISHFGGDEIEELLDVPRERIAAIPLAVSTGLTRPSEEEVKQDLSELGIDKPYLLFVSTIEPRKNVAFLADVMEALEDTDVDLVLAGGRGWHDQPIFERLQSSSASKRIRHLDYVPDRKLASLYAGTACFVFPSLYEGFGFTPLEAMALGAPVVSSNGGSLAEVLDDAATVLDTFEADRWADAVRRVLTDTEHRDSLVKKGYERAAFYTWEKTARATWDLYRKVAG